MFTEPQIKSFLKICTDKIASYKIQEKSIYFSAKFFRKNKLSDSINRGEVSTFSKLIRNHISTEDPDKIVIHFLENGTDTLLYDKTLKASEVEETEKVSIPERGLLGLGDVEAMVQKELQKYKEEQQIQILRKRFKRALGTIDAKNAEIEKLNKQIEEFEAQVEEFEETVSSDKRLQGYVAIAAEAFPSLNGIIQKSSLRGLLGVPKDETEDAAFTEIVETPKTVNTDKAEIDPKRKQMIDGITDYYAAEENDVKYLHGIYSLFHLVSLNPQILPTLLELASDNTTTPQ